MSTDEIKHFLVIYNLATDQTEVQPFGTDYDTAQTAYAEAERANADNKALDIVLLSADSLETIKQTHSSYFNGGTENSRSFFRAKPQGFGRRRFRLRRAPDRAPNSPTSTELGASSRA